MIEEQAREILSKSLHRFETTWGVAPNDIFYQTDADGLLANAMFIPIQKGQEVEAYLCFIPIMNHAGIIYPNTKDVFLTQVLELFRIGDEYFKHLIEQAENQGHLT